MRLIVSLFCFCFVRLLVIEDGITHCFERIEPPLNAASNDTLVVGQLLKWLISDNTVTDLYALVRFPFPGVVFGVVKNSWLLRG